MILKGVVTMFHPANLLPILPGDGFFHGAEKFSSPVGTEKHAVAVHKLHGVPLGRVVGSGDGDAALSAKALDVEQHGGGSHDADLDHVAAHSGEACQHGIEHHASGGAAVTAYDDGGGIQIALDEHAKAGGKTSGH